MTEAVAAAAGAWTLWRAGPADSDAVVALQRAAYARNRVLLGVEPLPLLADYQAILRDKLVWLALNDELDRSSVVGVLVLERRAADLMIESIATDPAVQGRGLGRAMLEAAEAQARSLGYDVIRLYTGARLTHLTDWYGRHGFTVECIETLSDRKITHMMKRITN